MRTRTTLALAFATLALGVTAAAAAPDGYQPQLAQPDAFDRYLLNNTPEEQPDALARYLRNNTDPAVASFGAAGNPDSRAVRPSPPVETTVAVGDEARDWTVGIVGAFGGALLAFVAVVGASSIRGRSRLALR
jgi:hypothetical protein